MATEQDNQPELELDGEPTPKKKGGRPGRKVVRENFYEVLRYFSNNDAIPYDDTICYDEVFKREKEISLIKETAPFFFETPECVEDKLKRNKDEIFELEKERDDYLDYEFEVRMSDLLHKKEELENKLTEATHLLDEHIVALQTWVHKNVPQTLWGRFKSGLRQKKHKRNYDNRTHKIDVKIDTYHEMKRLKDKMNAPDWESVLQRMLKETSARLQQEGK